MIKYYSPAFLWLVFITYLSVMPGLQLPKFTLISADKLAHAGVYAILTWLLLRAVRKTKGRSPDNTELLLAFGFSAAYGAFMEWVQGTFFPGRFFEYDDMLANAIGAAGACLWVWVRKRMPPENRF